MDHASLSELARYLRKRELRIAKSSGSHGPDYDRKVFIQLQDIARAKSRVRKAQRHAAIARGLAKGQTYYEIERSPTTRTEPNWDLVKTYLKKYIGRYYFVDSLTKAQLEGTVPIREIYNNLSKTSQLGQLLSDRRRRSQQASQPTR